MGGRQKVVVWTPSKCIRQLLEKTFAPLAVASDFGDREAVWPALGGKRAPLQVLEVRGHAADEGIVVASFFAHAALLAARREMRRKWRMPFPAGARAVEPAARAFVERYGEDALREVAKADFRTFDAAIRPPLAAR